MPSNCMPGSTCSGKIERLLEEHEVGVVVAERVLGLEMQLGLEAGLLVLQRFFHLGEQVVAAEEELDRVLQFVDQIA